jgi:hypothetical protein
MTAMVMATVMAMAIVTAAAVAMMMVHKSQN